MRSPLHRSITRRHVRLPIVLTVFLAAAAIGLGGAIGLLIGTAGGNPPPPSIAAFKSDTRSSAQATPSGIAVTSLTVAEGVDQPMRLGVGGRSAAGCRGCPSRWNSAWGRPGALVFE